ncbi:serine kinase [Candidatus Aerophobetes bacterium]|nr:serine kinase [Candidatus Aerophobetes bacterium]
MKLRELVKKFDLEVKCAADRLDRKIEGGYVSDLLSDVIANGRAGDVWVTLQVHQNIVGVASLKDLAAIIIINGRQPEENTIEKAENEGIPIMVSKMSAFELVAGLCSAGISGTR